MDQQTTTTTTKTQWINNNSQFCGNSIKSQIFIEIIDE